ncbi:MAG: Bpu10I family restriction endonuclease [Pirellulales bacterium]|nr:Bpu10I family restriction endonuclease [Pirellulales bacterium]
MALPTPHGDKLKALLQNDKLPNGDRKRIEKAVRQYHQWLKKLTRVSSDSHCVTEALDLLNEYRTFLDLEVVFDSDDDFLYRQKGQLKLDNTVIEEFLPLLVACTFPQISENFSIGPHSCFAALYFTSTIGTAITVPGAQARTKDQDFTISKRLYLRASFDPEHLVAVDRLEANLGYLCAECKTNLDKTMFQEACATAHDVKTAVPGAKYLLLCEWLDMTPISTAGTDVDEVLILRKAKRLGSQVRSAFATRAGRVSKRQEYAAHLSKHPFSSEVFERFLSHVRALLENRVPDEGDALSRGYF